MTAKCQFPSRLRNHVPHDMDGPGKSIKSPVDGKKIKICGICWDNYKEYRNS